MSERIQLLPRMEKMVFGCVALTFMMLPTGTAPPLLAAGLALIAWLAARPWQRTWQILGESWTWPVWPFIVLPWVGLTYSLNPELGLDYADKTKYWVALLITASLVMDAVRTRWLVQALWAGLLCGAILALCQVAGLLPEFKEDYPGFGIVHTLLSLYLIIGILMAAFYFRQAETLREKCLLMVLILAFIFHLAVMKGRVGYLIFMFISPVVARDLMYRFSLIFKIVTACLLVGALVLSPVFRDTLTRTQTLLMENRDKAMRGEDIPDMHRFYIFKQGLDAFFHAPLTGIGPGSLTEFTRPYGHVVTHPHNTFLYMGASFGVVGIGAAIWLYWGLFRISWPRRHTPLGYLVLSIVGVTFLAGMFDAPLLNTGTLLLFAMTCGFCGQLVREEPSVKDV